MLEIGLSMSVCNVHHPEPNGKNDEANGKRDPLLRDGTDERQREDRIAAKPRPIMTRLRSLLRRSHKATSVRVLVMKEACQCQRSHRAEHNAALDGPLDCACGRHF